VLDTDEALDANDFQSLPDRDQETSLPTVLSSTEKRQRLAGAMG
jgi:hypothetical protein